MEGKGIRSEEEIFDARLLYGINRILERQHELERGKKHANTENSNTAWTEAEEAELSTLKWIVELLLGDYRRK